MAVMTASAMSKVRFRQFCLIFFHDKMATATNGEKQKITILTSERCFSTLFLQTMTLRCALYFIAGRTILLFSQLFRTNIII